MAYTHTIRYRMKPPSLSVIVCFVVCMFWGLRNYCKQRKWGRRGEGNKNFIVAHTLSRLLPSFLYSLFLYLHYPVTRIRFNSPQLVWIMRRLRHIVSYLLENNFHFSLECLNLILVHT